MTRKNIADVLAGACLVSSNEAAVRGLRWTESPAAPRDCDQDLEELGPAARSGSLCGRTWDNAGRRRRQVNLR